MRVDLTYRGASGVSSGDAGLSVGLASSLGRDPVAFDAEMREPLRFREAMAALHAVVVSDLKALAKDRTAWIEWKKTEARRLREFRDQAADRATQGVAVAKGLPPGFDKEFERHRSRYWKLRQSYSSWLLRNDPELWRKLVPCDPVVTVAADAVLFEVFSKDESSYGCLVADRELFAAAGPVQCGTTNIDFSPALHEHMESLRSYRRTRLRIDPGGVGAETSLAGVASDTAAPDAVREEKIDLPPSWLRGFLQVQAAMGLPMRRVVVSREALHGVLAWLRRHRERASPRAIRFELIPGQDPVLVLEPWGTRIVSRGTPYQGPPGEPVRVWGRRRLAALARLLPVADSFEVHLLGTGFPSYWLARFGGLRFTLGLSGWTANDWTGGSALDSFAPPVATEPAVADRAAAALRAAGRASFAEMEAALGVGAPRTAAALDRLARTGQAIFDLGAGVYRWRQILPQALGEADLGPPDGEPAAATRLIASRRAVVERTDDAPGGGRFVAGKVGDTACEVVVDADGRIRRGKCSCSHHHQFGIRKGPCRHLLALRAVHTGSPLRAASIDAWYESLWRGNRW